MPVHTREDDHRPVHPVQRQPDAGVARERRAGDVGVGNREADARRPAGRSREPSVGQLVHRRLRQTAVGGVGAVDGVDGLDATAEELVVPERPRLARVVPDERDVGVVTDPLVDPVARRDADAGEEPADRGLPDAVPAVLDDRRREHEVHRDERRRDEREPSRDEDQRGRGEPDPERDEAERPEVDPAVLQPPPREQPERVGDGRRVDEPGERAARPAGRPRSGPRSASTRRRRGTTSSREARPSRAITAKGAT